MSEVLTAKEKLDKVFTDIAKAINDTDNNGAMSPEDMAERIEDFPKCFYCTSKHFIGNLINIDVAVGAKAKTTING